MGGAASSEAQKALECCTAVDVDEDAEARSGDPRRKVARDMCHGALNGDSLFTECLDERVGHRDRPGRSRNGSVTGSRASRGSVEGGQEASGCVFLLRSTAVPKSLHHYYCNLALHNRTAYLIPINNTLILRWCSAGTTHSPSLSTPIASRPGRLAFRDRK